MRTISDSIITAKDLLADIEKRFVKIENTKISTLLSILQSMKYGNKGNIREYIMEISRITPNLRAFKLDLSEDLLVHMVLLSLHAQFSQFKVSYNCQKETWSMNEFISHCVQKEERLKRDMTESSYIVTSSNKNKGQKRKKNKHAANSVPQKNQHNAPGVQRKVIYMFWFVLRLI